MMMRKILNVLDEEGMRKYQDMMFNQRGYSALKRFTENLVKMHYTIEKYPFRIGIILGIPSMGFARNILSKEDLLSRIKAYMQILGVKELTVTLENGSEMTFGFNEEGC